MNSSTEVGENIVCLRNEIIESEKARMDFLKFKLLSFAMLGAIGLGLKENGVLRNDIDYVLCVIPFIGIYIDLLCYHNNIRILTIAQYLSARGDKYESFMNHLSSRTPKKRGAGYFYNLEDFVVFWASFFVSVLLVGYGFKFYWETNKLYVFVVTGGVGIFVTTISWLLYYRRLNLLFFTITKLEQENKYKVNNSQIAPLLQNDYSFYNLKYIFNALKRNGTFNFKPLSNGLFPAATLTDQNKYTNYDKVWVRDNFYVALAHYQNGKTKQASDTLYALSDFFFKYKSKFIDIISGELDYSQAMNRPHIRFDGANLMELEIEWSHAQNDALGYYLWLICKMHNNNDIKFRNIETELFPLFIRYLKKIKYWKDEDSGHWEETRKIESSSIGVVLCALVEAKKCIVNSPALSQTCRKRDVDSQVIDKLIVKGKNALNKLLPVECKQPNKAKYRDVDAALLFLIYPMHLFEKEILDNEKLADIILSNVINKLEGEFGIKRYIGDSFWTADAKMKHTQSLITANYSTKIEERNRDHKIGDEAQWCIFDSIISIIYGNKYKKHRSPIFLNQQIHYFNRALSQISGSDCLFGEYKCPELYYIENGRYIYNDTVPLLWAQANLWLAFYELKRNVLLNKNRFDLLKKFRFGLEKNKLAFSFR